MVRIIEVEAVNTERIGRILLMKVEGVSEAGTGARQRQTDADYDRQTRLVNKEGGVKQMLTLKGNMLA